jgi:hypothetical protein
VNLLVVETDTRHKNNYTNWPWHTHQQKKNQYHFKPAIYVQVYDYILTGNEIDILSSNSLPLFITGNVGHLRRFHASLAKFDPSPNNHDKVGSDHNN